MGRDRRKRDRRQTPEVDSASNNVEINTTTGAQAPLAPRGQRENRIRPSQESREIAVKVIPVAGKPATENLSQKREETKEVPPDPAVLFANLKRETDDIKALTEKKFAKRQIFSNWSRYEEALPDPVQEEEELPGADFEALCASVTSESNYFRLKSERSWDTKISALSSELFSLNANVLAASLSCIPFYERLDLPITLFSEADVQKMKNSAKSCKSQYESSKSYLDKERDLLNILRERSSAEDNLLLKAEREKTPDHKPVLCFTIDRPETPDELEGSAVTEVCEQAHSMPPRATRISADIGRKGSPEIVSKVTSKIPETNMTPQDFRTSRLSPEKEESELQDFTENTTRHRAEISFNAVPQREEINSSPKRFLEDRWSPELVEKVEPSGKEIFQEIDGYIPEKFNVTPQRQSMSPKTEKIKHFNNDAGSEMSSCVVQQSESGPTKSVAESIPEPVPETLPAKQMNKSKSKQKKKQHTLKMATTSGTAADSEVASPQRESELKSETETVSNVVINEDVKPQEEVQKPPAVADSMGQRFKKRKSKEKVQHANKPVENAKMPTQDKLEITNVLAEKKTKPVATEIAVEKAKSPSPEKPFVKPHPVPQTKPAKIVNPKQEMVAEPVQVVQEKPVETAKLKEEKPVPKLKSKEEKPIGQENSKEEKPIGKVEQKEEKVKAPAQEKAVEEIKYYCFSDDSDYGDHNTDDLEFLSFLRWPIRESEDTPEASTSTSKPSIEEDDVSTTTEFVFSEKKQDLEDWLDSVLSD